MKFTFSKFIIVYTKISVNSLTHSPTSPKKASYFEMRRKKPKTKTKKTQTIKCLSRGIFPARYVKKGNLYFIGLNSKWKSMYFQVYDIIPNDVKYMYVI